MNTRTADDEMKLSDALRKAKFLWPNFPPWAFRQAIKDGVVPSRRSSFVKGALIYVRWSVLKQYWENLKA